MSEKCTSEEQNIVTGIRNSLNKNTKYMFYEGMEVKASQDVKETRAESIEFKVAQGSYFNISDCLILKEVHSLGVTNVATMQKRLAIEKRRYPDKSYPEYDFQSLKSRMQYLVRQGLLYSYEYKDTYNRSLFVFICSMYGWRFYKNKLMSSDIYDKNMVFKADTEIFKRLASNAVAYSFASSPSCTSVLINDTINYAGNKRGFVYARATLGEDEKNVFIIDPIYFGIDRRMISEEENIAQITARLTQLEEMIDSLKEKTPTKLVICLENYAGLAKVLNIIKTKDMNFYINNCYFTSENILFESNDVLSRSFLKLIVKDGQYQFSLARDKWF